MTKVSIITTCFNAEATIKETIESIHQNRGDFEIEHIVTDAGSKDRTLEICRSYGDKITVFETPGLNQSAGINFGLKKATGSIVTFLNADDLYYPDTLQSVVDAFRKDSSARWLTGYCPIIDEKGVEQTGWISSYKNFLMRHYSYFWLLVENFICQPSTFFRKDVLDEFGFFSESEQYCMDYEYWLRLGRFNKPIVLRRPLAKFRRMNSTKSNSGFEKQFLDDARLGERYARESGHPLAIPLKKATYLRTVWIYRHLYGT